jgi:hypothetical protein
MNIYYLPNGPGPSRGALTPVRHPCVYSDARNTGSLTIEYLNGVAGKGGVRLSNEPNLPSGIYGDEQNALIGLSRQNAAKILGN